MHFVSFCCIYVRLVAVNALDLLETQCSLHFAVIVWQLCWLGRASTYPSYKSIAASSCSWPRTCTRGTAVFYNCAYPMISTLVSGHARGS